MITSPIQLLIAGVQKGGTTSLAAYLDTHPSIVGHPGMELPYFVQDDVFEAGWERARRTFYGRRTVADDQLRLAKSVGVCFVPGCVERARRHNPDMRLIIILREPVARAFSAYRFWVARGLEHAPTFEEALALEQPRLSDDFAKYHRMAYVALGMYADQLRATFEHFDRRQVRVLIFEELVESPIATLEGVCEWLGIDMWPRAELERIVSTRHNDAESVGAPILGSGRIPKSVRRLLPAGVRPLARRVLTRPRSTSHLVFEPEVRASLVERFAEPNEELFRLLGRRIQAWERNPAK